MTTDEMLIEILNYNYKSIGFPYVFMDYSQSRKMWSITWRNPAKFSNEKQTESKTPNGACRKALGFISENPHIFCRSKQ